MKFNYLMNITFCLCVNFSLFCMEMPPSSKQLFEFIKKDTPKKPNYYSKFFQYFKPKQKSFDEKGDTSVFQDWVDNTVYHYCGLNNFNMDQFQYVLNEIKAKYPEDLKKNRDLPEFLAHFNTKTQTLLTETEPDNLEEINIIPINGPTKKKRKFMADPQLAFAIQTIQDNRQVFQKFIFEKIKSEPLLLNSVLFNNMARDIKLVLFNKKVISPKAENLNSDNSPLILDQKIKSFPENQPKCFYPYTFPKELASVFIDELQMQQNNQDFPYIIKKITDSEIIITKKGAYYDSDNYVELAFTFNGDYLKPINLPDQIFIDKEKLANFVVNTLLHPNFSLNKLYNSAIKLVNAPDPKPYKPEIENIFYSGLKGNTQQISEKFKILSTKTDQANQKNTNSKNWEGNLSFSLQDKPLIIEALKQQILELQKQLPLSAVTLQEEEKSVVINVSDNIFIPLLGNLNKFDNQDAKQPTSIKIHFIEAESGTIHKKWSDKEINEIGKEPERTIITDEIIFSQEDDSIDNYSENSVGINKYTNLVNGIGKHLFEDVENLIKNDKNSQIKKSFYETFSFNNQATIAIRKTELATLSLIGDSFDKLVEASAINLVQTHQGKLDKFCLSFGLLSQIIDAQKKLNQTKKELTLGDKKLTNYTNSTKQLQNANLKKISSEQQKKLYDDCMASLEAQFTT